MKLVAGVSVGVTPVKNAWAELGYNFEGFDDEDFDKSNFKRKGPYVDFRYKFNQDSIKGDLPIRRKTTAEETVKTILPKADSMHQSIDKIYSQASSEITDNKKSDL